jgi:hypothetical protein
MGLNRVSNPAKLRRLAALVGEPVLRAYAKFFTGHTLIVFGASGRQYAVDGDRVEPYAEDPPLVLVEHGIGTGTPDA